jgi:addiction module HigA family antidote
MSEKKVFTTRLKVHPGEILRDEFMTPLDLSARSLASALGVPPNRVTEIVRGERCVTADTAIRLGLHFGTTSQFWLNLQQAYDLAIAESEGDFSTVKRREISDAA